jgi:hypothetical protein
MEDYASKTQTELYSSKKKEITSLICEMGWISISIRIMQIHYWDELISLMIVQTKQDTRARAAK